MDASNLIFIRELDSEKFEFTLKIHVLKLWSNPSKINAKEKFSIDMICIGDEVLLSSLIFRLIFFIC